MHTKKVISKFSERNSSITFSEMQITLIGIYPMKGKWDTSKYSPDQLSINNHVVIGVLSTTGHDDRVFRYLLQLTSLGC